MINSPFFTWELQLVTWFSEHRIPIFDIIMKLFTFIGEETFYVSILPIIYWALSKRLGFQLALVLGSSVYLNGIAKDWFQVDRPYIAYPDQVTSLYGDPVGYAFPSGHAQGTLSFLGYIAYSLQTRFWTILTLFVILMVGLSRVYGGVHWPTDVLFGWALALMVLVIAHFTLKVLRNVELSIGKLTGIALIYGLIMLGIYYATKSDILLSDYDIFKMIGFVTFTIVAFGIERDHVRFQIPAQWWRRIVGIVIGMVGVLAIKEGVKIALPTTLWADFIRYGLVGLWAIALLPWVLVLTKIYPQEPPFYTVKTNYRQSNF